MRAKKSLGQNFLINPKVAERIALDAEISKKDVVLEIGPGTGNLTKYLLAHAGKVVALEKDDTLFQKLQETFAEEIQNVSLVLIHRDVLEFDINGAVLAFSNGLAGGGTRRTEDLRKSSKLRSYKIVANIPYNITGAILKKFLSAENKPESMTLMVQKEVAERILARDGKESLLSISVKAYGKPKILFKVGRGNFFPAPNVDSAVIKIENISDKIFKKNKVNENKFWGIVKKGFAHKRKKLAGNLKNVLTSQGQSLRGFENKRAEDLSLADWIILAKS